MSVFPIPMALARGAAAGALSFTADGTAQDNASAATQVYTMVGAIPTGALIVVLGAASASSGNLSSVSDSKGNVYAVNSTTSSAANSAGIAMAPCTVALAASDTVTLTWAGSGQGHAVAVGRISNPKAGTSADFDVQVTATGTSQFPTASTAALAQTNEIVFGMVASSNVATGTEDATFTNIANLLFKANTRAIIAGYKAVASTSAVTYAPTLAASVSFTECIATYKGQ